MVDYLLKRSHDVEELGRLGFITELKTGVADLWSIVLNYGAMLGRNLEHTVPSIIGDLKGLNTYVGPSLCTSPSPHYQGQEDVYIYTHMVIGEIQIHTT